MSDPTDVIINELEQRAENDFIDQYALASIYYLYRKNLEKAFYWFQKAAENGNKFAMYNLNICYKNGEGTEKNLEKAFYWYQKAAENGKVNGLCDKCKECEQPYVDYQWCQQCNSKRFQQDFLTWTSENEF